MLIGLKAASSLSVFNRTLYLDYSGSDLKISETSSNNKEVDDKSEYKYFGVSLSDQIMTAIFSLRDKN